MRPQSNHPITRKQITMGLGHPVNPTQDDGRHRHPYVHYSSPLPKKQETMNMVGLTEGMSRASKKKNSGIPAAAVGLQPNRSLIYPAKQVPKEATCIV